MVKLKVIGKTEDSDFTDIKQYRGERHCERSSCCDLEAMQSAMTSLRRCQCPQEDEGVKKRLRKRSPWEDCRPSSGPD